MQPECTETVDRNAAKNKNTDNLKFKILSPIENNKKPPTHVIDNVYLLCKTKAMKFGVQIRPKSLGRNAPTLYAFRSTDPFDTTGLYE